jgi:hypothetical protein
MEDCRSGVIRNEHHSNRILTINGQLDDVQVDIFLYSKRFRNQSCP